MSCASTDYYAVGNGTNFSGTYNFTTLPAPGTTPSTPTRIGVLADIGAF